MTPKTKWESMFHSAFLDAGHQSFQSHQNTPPVGRPCLFMFFSTRRMDAHGPHRRPLQSSRLLGLSENKTSENPGTLRPPPHRSIAELEVFELEVDSFVTSGPQVNRPDKRFVHANRPPGRSGPTPSASKVWRSNGRSVWCCGWRPAAWEADAGRWGDRKKGMDLSYRTVLRKIFRQ